MILHFITYLSSFLLPFPLTTQLLLISPSPTSSHPHLPHLPLTYLISPSPTSSSPHLPHLPLTYLISLSPTSSPSHLPHLPLTYLISLSPTSSPSHLPHLPLTYLISLSPTSSHPHYLISPSPTSSPPHLPHLSFTYFIFTHLFAFLLPIPSPVTPVAPIITVATLTTVITLTWRQPVDPFGIGAVDSYKVYFNYVGPCPAIFHRGIQDLNSSATGLTLLGMQEYSTYNLTVTTMKNGGSSMLNIQVQTPTASKTQSHLFFHPTDPFSPVPPPPHLLLLTITPSLTTP